uniref:Lamina-associated polypeptide 2, isoforms beta/gamma-like n=1 Tax=Erpetoichthys calabaricus TaxID=27687 RepID=A0A8C4RS71_ERPCA
MKNSKMMDICQMNDEELKAKLLEHGVIPGPIVASTRLVYEKKLLKLISQKSEPSSFKNNATVIEDQYSDSEEEEEEMESTVVQKKMKKTTKAIGNHTHVMPENNVKNKDADVYFLQCFAPCPSMIEPDCDMINDDKKEDILAELFPDEPRTPTGISATRRKPIKGAAGRPIQFKYNLIEKAQLSSSVESTPAPPRRLVPVFVQIVVFLLVVCFLFLFYQAMEVNQDFYVENESHFEAVDQNVPLPVAEEAAQPSSPMAIQE